ncbi:MAG: hypothetical protein N4A72_00760 [Bacteroidales bacterium]|jgi:hypothetical protein|nr:hypothetical protein [Bacteroidales bacterium]
MCKKSNHSVYIDRADSEYSIHCLDKSDLTLLFTAFSELQNRAFYSKEQKLSEPENKRVKKLKAIIENEILKH